MRLQRFASPAEFAATVSPYLIQNEAEHNLLLGLCSRLTYPSASAPEQEPYLALVEHQDQIVLVAMMTPPHNLVISRIADTLAIPHLMRDLYSFDPHPPGILGSIEDSLALARAWQGMTGQAYLLRTPQRIYQLEQVIPVKNVAGSLRPATADDRPLLSAWVANFTLEVMDEAPDAARVERTVDSFLAGGTRGYFLWEVNRKPVSMAAFTGPTPNGIRINSVYTPPECRRKGYASACVAALSQHLLDSGYHFCFLYTDLSNPTANHIYQEIGYRPICDINEYRFTNPA